MSFAELAERLMERLPGEDLTVWVGGPPGGGKTTIVSAIVSAIIKIILGIGSTQTFSITVIDETGSNQTKATQIIGPNDGGVFTTITFITNCSAVKNPDKYDEVIHIGLGRYGTFADYVHMLLGRKNHSLQTVVLSVFVRGGLDGVLKWFKSRFSQWKVEYDQFDEKMGVMPQEALVLVNSLIGRFWLSPLNDTDVFSGALSGKFTFYVGQKKGRGGSYNENPAVGSNVIYLAFVLIDGRHLTLCYYGRKKVSVDDAKCDLMEFQTSMAGESTAGSTVTVAFQKAIDAPNATYYEIDDVIRHASKKKGSLELFGCNAPVLNGNQCFIKYIKKRFLEQGTAAAAAAAAAVVASD